MQLRIIDNSLAKNIQARFVIEFRDEENGLTISYSCELDQPVLPVKFNDDLQHYYAGYPRILLGLQEVGAPELRRLQAVGVACLETGTRLGEALVGDARQLERIQAHVARRGYSLLDVYLQSSRAAFFDYPWETLILPGSKYVLSAAARRFVRVATASGERTGVGIATSKAEGEMLRIIHVVPVDSNRGTTDASSDDEAPSGPSYAFALAGSMHSGADRIRYRIEPARTPSALLSALTPMGEPVQVFHFDGPIVADEGAIRLVGLEVETLFRSLAALGAQLVCINPFTVTGKDAWRKTSFRLAELAHQCGIPNLITLGQLVDGDTARSCFEPIYQGLGKGLSIAQAVVEGRKQLQAECQASQSEELQAWLLPVHFSAADRLLLPPIGQTALPSSTTPADIPLHGFDRALTSAAMPPWPDGILPQVLLALREETGRVVLVSGDEGVGKTSLAHRLADYLTRAERCDSAFYFDYKDHDYLAEDIHSMLLSVSSGNSSERPATDKSVSADGLETLDVHDADALVIDAG
jgi:hypothetical protein